MNVESINASRDIFRRGWIGGAVFGLPCLAFVVSGFLDLSLDWRTAIWVAGLTTMGVACVANALRCGRLHCYLTGPFFLVMAIATLLYGLGLVPFGKHGWNLIGAIVLIGGLVLWRGPEAFLGPYRRARTGP
jgi:hypothetical protein